MKLFINFALCCFFMCGIASVISHELERGYEKQRLEQTIVFMTNEFMSVMDFIRTKYDFTALKNDEKHDYYVYTWQMSEKHDVPFNILSNLLFWESGYNHSAYNENENGTYDSGIAQVNSNYKDYFEYNYGITIDTSYEAIEFAAIHLNDMFEVFGNYEEAVMAYNCGKGAVLSGNIPLSTQRYVKEIMNMQGEMK